ncbi:hypothetical protein DSO57_1017991 [Entomophthora muscae]|nr:hypothetical protein DSO57_1017991 [Entomophthora muscae]
MSLYVPKNKVSVLVPKLNIIFKGVPEGLQSIMQGETRYDEDYPDLSPKVKKVEQRPHKRKARQDSEKGFPEFRQTTIKELKESLSAGLGLFQNKIPHEHEALSSWDEPKVDVFSQELERVIAFEFFGDSFAYSKESKLGYSRKVRSIKVFLGSCANTELFKQIVHGLITTTGLVQTGSKYLLSPEEKIRHDHFCVNAPSNLTPTISPHVKLIRVAPYSQPGDEREF